MFFQYDIDGSIFFLMVILPMILKNICFYINFKNVFERMNTTLKTNNTSFTFDFMANVRKVKDITISRTCSSKYGICYLIYATFNASALSMIKSLKFN